MNGRSILLGISVFLFAALTMTFGGVAFCYKLEGDSLQERMEIEKKNIARVRFEIEGEVGIQSQIDKLQNTDIKTVKEQVDDPTTGLLTKIKDSEGAAKNSLDQAQGFHQKRNSADDARHKSTAAAVQSMGVAYRDMLAQIEKLRIELDGREAELEKIQNERLKVMAEGRGRNDEVRAKLLDIRERIGTLETKLERMRERSQRLRELHRDGTLLSADPNTSLAVVDLGRRHGVRPGMIFEIFEVRRDGNKFRKGKLRLRRVESHQSFATILAAREVPKYCPKCGWFTNEISHRFCPYCLGGDDEKEREAQRLVEGSTQERVVAAQFLNPVKKGDFVSSPFYLGRLRKRAFTFAIIGRTVNRSPQEITTFLKENSCRLATEVNMDTDFAIVGVGENIPAQIEKARKMGVSVIREKELFDFFGKAGAISGGPAATEEL
jgi:hypothetical protein